MSTLKKYTAVVVATFALMFALKLVGGATAEATPGFVCPTGSIEDNNGKCRKPVADAVACPEWAEGVPGACYIFVDSVEDRSGKTCRPGSVQDNDGKCRKPVANAIVCPDGAYGVPGACYVFVPKVATKLALATR